ncbi:unnamed protein product [Rangifer tarandus platyrhynchus]|uniref:Uncharacterized protein n=1 Tax=Rangifer tarandus platyrhynchus TaxID=3082113 RepID=A0ACB1KGR6_RANTA
MLFHTFRDGRAERPSYTAGNRLLWEQRFLTEKEPSSTSSSLPSEEETQATESPGCEHQQGPQNGSKSSSIIYRGGAMFSRSKDYPKPHDLLLTTQATGPSYTFVGRERRREKLPSGGVNS